MTFPWPFHKRAAGESEATRSRKAAEAELRRVQANTAFYAELGASLRKIREENHLTELVMSIPRRRHP